TAGSSIYATEEHDVSADGTYGTALVRIDTRGASKVSLLDELLKMDRTELKVLGVAGTSVFAFHQEEEGPDGKTPGAVHASSLWTIKTEGGPPHAIADFIEDVPHGLGTGVVADKDFAYWMNRSGKIFKLPISGL